jgi:hypothetical protein
VLGLQRLQDPHQRTDLLDGRHLGQGEHEPVRDPAGLHQGADDADEGADPAPPGRGLEAAEPDAGERRGGAGRDGRGELDGGALGLGVLLRVRPDAVAVLEVDAQVLDRLGAELLPDPLGERAGQLVRHAPDRGEVRGVGVQRGERLGAPARGGVPGVAVRGDVDGVHRLPSTGIAGVARGQCRVDVAQLTVEFGRERIREIRHAPILRRSPPGVARSVTTPARRSPRT